MFKKGHRTWTDTLEKSPKLRNMDIRFGTWNERNLYRADLFVTVLKELSEYMFSGGTRGHMGQVAPNQQANVHFSMESGMRIMTWVQLSFVGENYISI
jgi:hypothetical protein